MGDGGGHLRVFVGCVMGIGHVITRPVMERYVNVEIVKGELLVGSVNIVGLDQPVKIVIRIYI